MKKLILIYSVLAFFICNVYANEKNIYAIIYEDSVVIWHINVFTHCAASIFMDVQINDNEILILEKDLADVGADCLCYFNLSVTLFELEPGDYKIIVKSDSMNEYSFLDSLYFLITTQKILAGTNAYKQDKQTISVRQYQSECSDTMFSAIEPDKNIPETFTLLSAYPNPFNPVTTINYTIHSPGRVNLTVYNVVGKKIVTLVDEFQNANTYRYTFNGSELSSGVYFCQLTHGSIIETRKLLLAR